MYCKWIRIDLLFGNTSVHNGHFEVVNDVSDFVKYFFSNDSDTFTSLIFRVFCFKWLFCRWIQMPSLLGKTSLHIWHCSGIEVFLLKIQCHSIITLLSAPGRTESHIYTVAQLLTNCTLLTAKSQISTFQFSSRHFILIFTKTYCHFKWCRKRRKIRPRIIQQAARNLGEH